MSNELVLVNSDLAVMPVMDIALAIQRREQIVKFTQMIMVRDTDFGIIPGTDKPTLLKPGAEKLTTFFGLTKRFGIIERVEDWTGKDHNGEPFFYYLYRCGLYRGDMLIAESDGSCSSFEGKYRYRKSERVCPNCGQANIRKSKSGDGWYCWQKTGGCGATFKKDDQAIASQEVGRIANPDVCDQVNTIQKMAQKRALIAATLLAVNASEFFTQDLEDYVDMGEIKPEPSPAPATTQPQPANGGNGHTEKPSQKKPFKFPSTAAEKFYDEVQAATNNGYDSPFHFMKVLGNWFNFASQDLWDERKSYMVDHIRTKLEAAAPVEVENQAVQEEIAF